MDLLFLSRHYRCLPGQGDLPVATMPRKLEEIGYRGPISHEIFSDDFRALSARRIATDGMRSFLWLDEQIGSRVPPAALPTIDRVEFIEFVEDRSWPGCCMARAFAGAIDTVPRTSNSIARAR
jgi:4-hydroxyphenylpyruvate dioxygenase